jgi:hypothetical protein
MVHSPITPIMIGAISRRIKPFCRTTRPLDEKQKTGVHGHQLPQVLLIHVNAG